MTSLMPHVPVFPAQMSRFLDMLEFGEAGHYLRLTNLEQLAAKAQAFDGNANANPKPRPLIVMLMLTLTSLTDLKDETITENIINSSKVPLDKENRRKSTMMLHIIINTVFTDDFYCPLVAQRFKHSSDDVETVVFIGSFFDIVAVIYSLMLTEHFP